MRVLFICKHFFNVIEANFRSWYLGQVFFLIDTNCKTIQIPIPNILNKLSTIRPIQFRSAFDEKLIPKIKYKTIFPVC